MMLRFAVLLSLSLIAVAASTAVAAPVVCFPPTLGDSPGHLELRLGGERPTCVCASNGDLNAIIKEVAECNPPRP